MDQTIINPIGTNGKRIFPLFTIQSLSERWGVHRNIVTNWAKRHSNFCEPIAGVVTETKRTPKYYPYYEVIRYEKEKDLQPGN